MITSDFEYRRCVFEGHIMSDDSYQLPVQMPFNSEPTVERIPLTYWDVRTCRRCGMEEGTPVGFTPKRAANNGEASR